MQFTYNAYKELLELLHEKEYLIRNYHDYNDAEKCVILRHDIDYDLQRTVAFSEIEKECNVKSTYFVLLTSDFYNPTSKSSLKVFDELRKNGHEIGLHFDEVHYALEANEWSDARLIDNVLKEVELLGKILDEPIRSVSMHRPSKFTLEGNFEIPGIVNSYSEEFFHGFKYVSDSRMRWREDIKSIILSNKHDKLHILTHPFWYSTNELRIDKILEDFINCANKKRFEILNDNITGLASIIDTNNVR